MRKSLFWAVLGLLLWPSRMWAAPPQRIVSLSPANTEMLFALGLGSHVVGDTTYCDYPPAARKVTKIGDTRVNYERVASLHPDLIVGDAVATPEADARLMQLHLPVLALRPDTVAGVERSILLLGTRTGTTKAADMVVARMQRQERTARNVATRDPRHPSVLLVVGMSPLFVAGRGTFMDDVLSEAGGDNAAGVSGYANLSKERLIAHPPDIIVADPADQAAMRADPTLRLLPAVRLGRFVWLDDPNLLVRPGPRITLGLLELAQALHQEAR